MKFPKVFQNPINILVLIILGPFQLLGGLDYRFLVRNKYYILLSVLVLLILGIAVVGRKQWQVCGKRWNIRLALLVGFMACTLVSLIFSQNTKISFFGTLEHYNGTLLYLILGVAVLGVEMYGMPELDRRFCLDWFLGFSVVSAIWGILNSYGCDFFYMHAKIAYEDRYFHYAAIGQKTIYSELLVLATCVAFMLYSLEESHKKRLWYGIVCGILFYAGYLSLSDNYFLGVLPTLWLMLPLCLWKKDGIKRILEIAIVLMATGWAVFCVGPNVFRYHGIYAMPQDVIEFDAIASVFIKATWIHALLYLVVILRIIVGKMNVQVISTKPAKGFAIRTGIFAAGIAFFIGILVYLPHSNFILPLGRFIGYLRFDDDWGSGRGFIWKNAVTIFKEAPIGCKVFGNGSDMVGRLMVARFGDSVARYGATFDNAHNEYLQYLICYGIAGLGFYLAWMGSSLVNIYRKVMDGQDAESCAIMAAMLGYLIQAVVGIGNVAVMPLFFLLIALGCSKKYSNETVRN